MMRKGLRRTMRLQDAAFLALLRRQSRLPGQSTRHHRRPIKPPPPPRGAANDLRGDIRMKKPIMVDSRAPQGPLCPTCRVDPLLSERQGIEPDYFSPRRGAWLDRGGRA